MQNPSDLLPALVLGGAVAFWVAGFDIIYACQDYEFDRQAKLRSVPTQLGIAGALRLTAVCHAVTVVLLALLPTVYPLFGTLYWLGVIAVALLLILRTRPRSSRRSRSGKYGVFQRECCDQPGFACGWNPRPVARYWAIMANSDLRIRIAESLTLTSAATPNN